MKSTLVEFLRFKNLQIGVLREGDDYLCTADSLPVREVPMNMNQRPFNNWMKALRYEDSEPKRREALVTLSAKATELLNCGTLEEGTLGKILESQDGALQQLDFVANAAELSAIPFEAALSASGDPLFLGGNGVVMTRRVRGAFTEEQPSWPTRPRVLFAWSSAGGDVPKDEHREALLDALGPWLPPRAKEREKVYVEIGDARLSDIEAAAGSPGAGFTHVHLLAHGAPVTGDNDDRFGIALNGVIEGQDTVAPEMLAQALRGVRSSSVVVTLAACDLGNQTDTITPEKSVAHELHISGIPVVVASQLPLTVEGSIILVRCFYRDLLGGADVRKALHRVRTELYETPRAGHDWVSLVGYVRLNEGYVDSLKDIGLRARLASLDNLRKKVDVLEQEGAARDRMQRIRILLEREIGDLENMLIGIRDDDHRNEALGLLGSAEKRLAELCFRHFDDDEGRRASRAALEKSRDWYARAFRKNPSHHWSGVQYLALDGALRGTFDPGDWRTCYYAAQVDRARESEFWALGSLAELALLGRIIGANSDETAEAYLAEMKDRVAALPMPPDYDPFGSTSAQLRRYVDWWKPERGFFPGAPALAADAERLADFLQASDDSGGN